LTNGSGRLDLAQEIASAKNPLTARVFANRVWSWHFGSPLVSTPSDFGVRTASPVHRDLLDWLAASFVEHGWSVKQLHRWIVLSSTYRQSSDANVQALAVDPDNQLFHHFQRRRLEFEALRDTLLAAAGTLDLQAGGLPDDLMKEPFTTRRTVYAFIDRQNLPGMLRTFDYPNPDVSSAGRFATTVPQQALFMLNSPFVQEQARALVRNVEGRARRPGAPGDGGRDGPVPPEAARVRALYRIVYQREPDAGELELARAFLRRPARVVETRVTTPAGWQYGYGEYDAADNRVRGFTAMGSRRDGRISPGEKYPDAKFGHLSITATGGHPGRAPEYASIRRWIAPGLGKLTVEGTLAHANANGDGVRGRIVSSDGGRYGEWTVHNSKAETKLELEVQGGETLDFVVDCLGNPTADGYTWAPSLVFTPGPESGEMAVRSWNAKKDFENTAKPAVPLTRWEELAQVLLLSNELAFVD
jgi:YD repeat-containing protein